MEKEIMTRESEKMPLTGAWVGPFQAMENWFEDIENRWMQPRWLTSQRMPVAWGLRVPRVDVIDRDREICVRAELPGIDKEDVNLSIQDDVLTIQAKMVHQEHEEKGTFYRRELVQGAFQRTLQLPTPVNAGEAKASFKDGVMQLTVPKKPGYQPTKIHIQ